jgi:pimeloyl-ACP methyl ester carboxylesterase
VTIERGLVRTRLGHVHYRAAGIGDPILLLHINQQSSSLYVELLAELAPRFRAVALARFCMGWEREAEIGKRVCAFRDAVAAERRTV